MTATDVSIDYNGRTEFLIDAAVYPGSSGSPVVVADEGGWMSRGGMYGGNRLKLLGIVYAVHQFTQSGAIEIRQIPTAFDIQSQTAIPCNLGVVIKAERLNDFMPLFRQIEDKAKEMDKKAMQATR